MKILSFSAASSQKTNIQEGLPKKGAGTVCRFKRGLDKKEWVVFRGVDTPMHTINHENNVQSCLSPQ